MSVGRNDPCPCGSGKKYKKCCLPPAEIVSLESVRVGRTHEALLDRLLKYTAAPQRENDLVPALFRFFGGPPPEDPIEEEMDLPLDWVIFANRSPIYGTTPCEQFAAQADGLTSEERNMVTGWTAAYPGFFHVVNLGARDVQLRRLWDTRSYVVTAGGTGLRVGDLVAAWLLPVPSGLRFGYKVFSLPPEASGPLEHVLREELSLLRRQRPDATWDDLYRHCWPRLIDDAMLASVNGEALRRVRVPGSPSVRGTPKSNSRSTAIAERVTEEMKTNEAHPEEIAGALRLWWDAVLALEPRVTREETWAGGLLYLMSSRVYGSALTQAEVAEGLGISAATVGARAREIDAVLNVEPLDPRYVDLLDPVVRNAWRLECLTVAEAEPLDLAPLLEQAMRGAELGRREDTLMDDSPVSRAEGLVDEAWEAAGARRSKLAKQALKLWPEAADAYVILGNEAMERGDLQSARHLYQEGVRTGERALGKAFFDENTGHFWGLIETRPYMRARHGLADCLWLLGEREAAVAHYHELLGLNPGDNQGVRYTLASCFLEMGDDERLGKLLAEHADDGMAAVVFTRALWKFRKGPGREADELLRDALEENPHVPAYLLGERPLPAESPAYIGWGDETEAAAYAISFGAGWSRTPGALRWLASRTGR